MTRTKNLPRLLLGLVAVIGMIIGLGISVNGVVVTDVEMDSAASGILQQNDIIMQIDKQNVASVGELREAAAASAEKTDVLVLVYRNGGRLFVTITPES